MTMAPSSCRRAMEIEPFAAVMQDPRFDVLVFSRTTGFRHAEAIDAGHAAIEQMGAELGREFTVTASEDAGLFTDTGLRPYEVIVLLNIDGEGILNGAQRTAFERWAQRGGGIVSIHAAANADRDWEWTGDMMGGAWFQNHPSGANQFQTATVNVEDASHPATASLPNPWVREDEWYNFTAEPRGKVHVLLDARREHLRGGGRLGRGGRPPDRVVLELRRRAPLLHRARPPRHVLGRGGLPRAHPRRDRVGRRPGRGRLRRDARGPAHRRLVRQGHAGRQHREPDGAGGRARRQRLLHRAGRPGEDVRPGRPQRPNHRHDPGPPRQRERPARDHARSGLRDEQAAVPVLQRAPAAGARRRAAPLPLHARRERQHRHGLRGAAARVPAPAADLLPLRGLAGLRAGR